jgi:hypothetical protein
MESQKALNLNLLSLPIEDIYPPGILFLSHNAKKNSELIVLYRHWSNRFDL